MSKPSDLKNRDAMAYMLFRRFGCSVDEALAAIDELAAHFSPVKLCAERRWRTARKRRAPETARTSEGN